MNPENSHRHLSLGRARGRQCSAGYSFSNLLALPLRIFALSSADRGSRSAHAVPGGLSTNG